MGGIEDTRSRQRRTRQRWPKTLAILGGAAVLLPLAGCSTPISNFGPEAPPIPGRLIPTDMRRPASDGNSRSGRTNVVANAKDIREQVGNAGGEEAYVAAGYSETWNACSNYFDALIQIQNQVAYGGDVVTAAGTATSAMVALRKNASDSAKSLARIAAGTSFVTTLLSNFDDRALMTPYPSETKSLILAALQTFEASAPPDSATTASEAAMLVERHAELCTYSGITRFAKQALALAEVEADKDAAPSLLQRQDRVDVAGVAISLQLGQQALSDRQLALLYSYIVLKQPPHGDAKADALFDALPSRIDALGRDPADRNKRADPDTVVQFKAAKVFLEALGARNAAFKEMATKSIDALEAPAPAKTVSPGSAPPDAGSQASPLAPAPAAQPETPRPSGNWSAPNVRVRRGL